MNPNAAPEPENFKPELPANPSEAELIDRRSTLATVGKYSAPLIAALLPGKAKAFTF
jgi:hypothetical protein